ncbi:MAG TPA: lytic transglycosylase domain-containing protein [Rugosimonospora sp.]|nr:lytic transglycosylase domain-containing protein [Rugosimonospora sp.]
MSRLWSRFGLRALATGLLVAGLVGGVALGIDRQTQQRITASGQAAATDADDVHQIKVDQADLWRATAGQRAAQADAQAKANAAAAAAAASAKAADDAARAQQAASRSQTRTATVPNSPPVPISKPCTSYSGNQATGCSLLASFGFGLDQMGCLVNLWNRESNWRTNASNPSGAYGIPQAKPGSKMATYGGDWRTNAATQIRWGLNYIKGRYSNPCGAWAHSQATGWY